MKSKTKHGILTILLGTVITVVVYFDRGSKQDSLRHELTSFVGKEISIDDSLMVLLQKDDIIKNQDRSFSYKMIIYFDSVTCTSCKIKTLFLWNEFLELEKSGNVHFFFIFDSKNVDYVYSVYDECNLKHSILIDTCKVFKTMNPFLPNNPLMHCFLLNRENKVIFVGNVVESEKLEKIFKQIMINHIQEPSAEIIINY